jgi:hypothetical protein
MRREVFDAVKKEPRKLVHNAGPASNYDDNKKRHVVESELNLRLFLGQARLPATRRL